MKTLLIIGCLLLFSLTCIAQPKIFFPETIRHFGTIEPNSDGTRHFVFANIGDEPLVIKQCKTSCGCLVASWPREPIQPGEWAEIQLRFHTGAGRVGRFVKSITVKSNDSLNPIHILRIKGNILSDELTKNELFSSQNKLFDPGMQVALDTLSFSTDLGIDTMTQDTNYYLMINTHLAVDVLITNHLIHDTYLEGDTLVLDVRHLDCGRGDEGNMKRVHQEAIEMPPIAGKAWMIEVKYNREKVLLCWTIDKPLSVRLQDET